MFVDSSLSSGVADGQLAVLDLDTGETTLLGLAGVSPHYVSTGHLVYAAEDGSLRAVAFDATSLEVTGNPVPLVEGVLVKGSGAADFSISDNGRLVYAAAGAAGGTSRTLVWVGPRRARGTTDGSLGGGYRSVDVSPDGSALALEIGDGPESDIWTYELARGTLNPLTTDRQRNRLPSGRRMDGRCCSRRAEAPPGICIAEMRMARARPKFSSRTTRHKGWSPVVGFWKATSSSSWT